MSIDTLQRESQEEIAVNDSGVVTLSGRARELVLDSCLYYCRLITPEGGSLSFAPDFLEQTEREGLLTDHAISMLALRGIGARHHVAYGHDPERPHFLLDDNPLIQALARASGEEVEYLPLDEIAALKEKGILVVTQNPGP